MSLLQELLRERVQLTRQLEAQDAEAVEAANHLLAVSSERDAAESKAQVSQLPSKGS